MAADSIRIELTPEEAHRLRCEAERLGVTPEEAARRLLLKTLPGAVDPERLRQRRLAALEALARMREQQPVVTDVVELLADLRRERDEQLLPENDGRGR